jgi:hypothetical protein
MNYNKHLIKCVCIDDSARPNEIKQINWIKKEQEYTVIATAKNPITNDLMFQLAEVSTECQEYWGYKSTRFAFRQEDLDRLFVVEEEPDLKELEEILEIVK